MILRVEGGLTYSQTFDIENRFISVTVNGQTTQFVYDGDGNLVKKINPDGSRTLYIGGIYEIDKSPSGSVTRTVTYYPLGGAMRINDTLYFILKDHLGSASAVTDAAGNLLGQTRYDPYGETRWTTGNMMTDKLFTGQRAIAALDIYHYQARFYSPSLGRFLSADTVIPNAAIPQTWNRYAYSLNNPINYADPSGHWPCSLTSSGFSCTVSTFGIGPALDQIGKRLGVENASQIVSEAVSTMSLGFDIAAEVVDFAASAIVTTGIIVGATAGAAITLPGGETAVVTGVAGASVGWATTELGVKPLILAGNALASLATLATVSSELISGDTGFEATLGISAEGVKMSSQVVIGSASQVSILATTAGWISPLAYPSLGMQTVAIMGDLGVISPPPINIEFAASLSKRSKAELKLKWERGIRSRSQIAPF
ncbi:MAG TPA: RHS repeat-associated core domain-containing protein [Anaerolineales bacterium]|nr:RHS repeat-associated core domain-containing protein [Anaerolineales bacterium]